MARPKDVVQREWLRSAENSEAAVFLELSKEVCKPHDKQTHKIIEGAKDRLTGYCGSLTLRDCTRSVSLDLYSDNDDDLEALRAVRDYADKALRWIERCRTQMAREEE